MTTQLPGNESEKAVDKFPSLCTPIGVGLIGIAANIFFVIFLGLSEPKAPLGMGAWLIWLCVSPVVMLVVFSWGFWRHMKNSQYVMLFYVLGIVLILGLFFSTLLPSYLRTKEDVLRVRSHTDFLMNIRECKFDGVHCRWCKKDVGTLWFAASSYDDSSEQESYRAWFLCNACGKRMRFDVPSRFIPADCLEAFKARIHPELRQEDSEPGRP